MTWTANQLEEKYNLVSRSDCCRATQCVIGKRAGYNRRTVQVTISLATCEKAWLSASTASGASALLAGMLPVNMRALATVPLSLTSRAVTSTTAFGDGSKVI